MKERIKMGCMLIFVYSLVTMAGRAFTLIPGVPDLHLNALLSLTYGMVFGRLGAFSAGLGALLGSMAVMAQPILFPFEFLTAFLSAYVPFRVWQGMRSEREPVLLVCDGRTRTMAFILSIISAVPVGLWMGLGSEMLRIVPFTKAFLPIMIPTLIFSIIGAQTVFMYAGRYFFRENGKAVWEQIRDDKWTSHLLAVAILRISLTALAVAFGFCWLFQSNFGEPVIEYTIGALSVVILVMTGM
ncbi:MAG: hypothetical protein LKE33_10695 [Acidaminococcus sp.]|jgi:energy-coupling factor transport system substrate-specific component|nr:hypothetical protein [Acidaminococcus sp.]MCI2101141.1 hypothetical protein [Acidaminococcus sp.]MCI2115539.1 hypothetical protein [Acidaminococcus sp.]MCI2117678.1 hypothetical protein [Acidaminococcus sp.]